MSKKILVVDDEKAIVAMVKIRLEANGYTVFIVNSGMEGIAMAAKEAPDLILLDITMPEMDGYTVLKKLKAMNETKNIPVIMFTSRETVDEIEKAYELGAIDYIAKPFNPVILVGKINDVFTNG